MGKHSPPIYHMTVLYTATRQVVSYIAIRFGEKNNNNESEVIPKCAIIRSLGVCYIQCFIEVCEQSYHTPAQTDLVYRFCDCRVLLSVVKSGPFFLSEVLFLPSHQFLYE